VQGVAEQRGGNIWGSQFSQTIGGKATRGYLWDGEGSSLTGSSTKALQKKKKRKKKKKTSSEPPSLLQKDGTYKRILSWEALAGGKGVDENSKNHQSYTGRDRERGVH